MQVYLGRGICPFVVTGKNIGYIYKTVSLESHGKYQYKLASSVKWNPVCTTKAFCLLPMRNINGDCFTTSMHPSNATTQEAKTRYLKAATISTT